jgi:hypothetical protein
LSGRAKFREGRRAIARFLIVAIFLGGLPFAASGMLARHAPTAAFTLDICHPISPGAVRLAASDLSPLTVFAFAYRAIDLGAAPVYDVTGAVRAPQAPDPPPPRSII